MSRGVPPEAPAIAAILPCDDRFETIADVLGHYRAQTVRERVEIVVVAPAPRAPEIPASALAPFHSAQVLAHGPTIGAARAEGVRRARAPVVLIGETHSYPHPGALEALIEAHRGPSAAVMMRLGNANPGPLSWTNLAMDYGTWVGGDPGAVTWLPTHNSAFKRSALLALGDRLAGLLDLGSNALGPELVARGHALGYQPRARTLHINVSSYASCARHRLAGGRMYAGRRSRAWSRARRALYAVGAPAIPLARLPRVLGDLRRAGLGPRALARMAPALAFSLGLSAVGEGVGYALGPGEGRPHLIADVEIHRARHTRPGDLPVPLGRHGP
jgi:hypothetical protein